MQGIGVLNRQAAIIHLESKDADETLDKTFGKPETKEQKPQTDMEEFVKMFKAWKQVT